MLNRIESILAKWHLRILFYLLICFFLISPFILQIFSKSNTISIEYLLITIFALSSLAIAVIESLRKNGSWKTFGFAIDRFSSDQISNGFLYAVLSIFSVGGVAYLFDYATISQICPYSLSQVLLLTFALAGLEEVGFRGYILQNIYERFGTFPAIILSALSFALAHIQNSDFSIMGFINTALVGAILMTFWIRTKTLWAPLAFHFTWNILYYNVIELKIINLAQSPIAQFLFGFEYGIEEGFLTTLFLLIYGAYFIKRSQESPYLSSIIFKRKYEESKLIS